MISASTGDAAHPKLLCRLYSGMASKDSVLAVDEDRNQKAKFCDCTCELIDLRLRMKARIIPVRPQILDREVLNPQDGDSGPVARALRDRRAPRSSRVKGSALTWGRLHSCPPKWCTSGADRCRWRLKKFV